MQQTHQMPNTQFRFAIPQWNNFKQEMIPMMPQAGGSGFNNSCSPTNTMQAMA